MLVGMLGSTVRKSSSRYDAEYRLYFRDGETTIKIFVLLLRGGLGGRGDRPKTLVFVGNAMTIKY